ncbi:SIR2 family protein [Erysipelothrix rhusiopathiae]|nr:SIR2 family protein [Erysipelothrix rhusiopathiae]MDE8193617.1 SIR2 family protein [Erysipelothrix rhusiopathiae]MDE8204358.1 SIR2 family protein [Erysipelothrix rhusiopathiae]MDE8240047.1 SIR2 family protein [Erysipelothrix rhusiopathiae]MDE8288452.1 SIR2 family protein [Erysipelothrix rhusiopathiae]
MSDVEKDLVSKLRMGNTLLFVGAGFNAGLKNINGSNFPFMRDLEMPIKNILGAESVEYLSDIGDLVDEIIARDKERELISFLKKEFTYDGVESFHQAIAKVNWKSIYSTNYDDVVEMLYKKENQYARSVTVSDKMSRTIDDLSIVHLNGSINKLNPGTLNEEFKLSDISYLRMEKFLDSNWINKLRSDIESASCIVFLGVSFNYDIDIKRILVSSEEVKSKVFFINKKLKDLEISEHLYHKQHRIGNVVNIGIEGFCSILEDNIELINNNTTDIPYSDFVKYSMSDTSYTEVHSTNIRELLKYGDLDLDVLKSSMNSQNYTLKRYEEIDIIEKINKKIGSCFVISSNMSNGKTLMATRLGFELSKKYEVYKLVKESKTLSREIEQIVRSKNKKIIIVEDYTFYTHILSIFSSYINDETNDMFFILTSRSALNDNMVNTVNQYLGIPGEKIFEYEIDNIHIDDKDDLINILNAANYLDGYNNKYDRKRAISNRFENQFRNILISVVKSPKFIKDTQEIYLSISENNDVKSLIICASICKVIGMPLHFNDYLKILDLSGIPAGIKKDPNLRIFLDFDESSITSKSAIFSEFILNNCAKPEEVIDMIYEMLANSENCIEEKTVTMIKRQLISISNISVLMKGFDKKYREYVLEYYNKIKTLEFNENNVYFWIQFSMACMDIEDFERANHNLEVAERIENKNKDKYSGYTDNYQITVQRQRFLIENAIKNGSQEPFKVFTKTYHNLMPLVQYGTYSKLIQKHLVFKQLSLYEKLYEKYKSEITPNESKELFDMIKTILEEIERAMESSNEVFISKTLRGYTQSLERLKIEVLKGATVY